MTAPAALLDKERRLREEVKAHKREITWHRSQLKSKAEKLETLRQQLKSVGITLTIGAEETRHGRNRSNTLKH